MNKDITTIQLERETKLRLVSIKSTLSLDRGRDLTFEEVIQELLKIYEKQ